MQNLTKSELQRCAIHLLGRTVERTLAYPKIFLRRPKNKAFTYSIKAWCNHCKLKTTAMRDLCGLRPEMHLFLLDGDVNWMRWKEFKMEYNINGASMPCLVKEHSAVLKLKGNKRTKKTETKHEEVARYISFLDTNKSAKFKGLA